VDGGVFVVVVCDVNASSHPTFNRIIGSHRSSQWVQGMGSLRRHWGQNIGQSRYSTEPSVTRRYTSESGRLLKSPAITTAAVGKWAFHAAMDRNKWSTCINLTSGNSALKYKWQLAMIRKDGEGGDTMILPLFLPPPPVPLRFLPLPSPPIPSTSSSSLDGESDKPRPPSTSIDGDKESKHLKTMIWPILCLRYALVVWDGGRRLGRTSTLVLPPTSTLAARSARIAPSFSANVTNPNHRLFADGTILTYSTAPNPRIAAPRPSTLSLLGILHTNTIRS
jgi:hypothetical protein